MELLQLSVKVYTVTISFLTSCSCILGLVAEFKKVKIATSDQIYNSSHPLSFFRHVDLQKKLEKTIQKTDEDNSSSWKLFSEFLLGVTSNCKGDVSFLSQISSCYYCKSGGAGRLYLYKE